MSDVPPLVVENLTFRYRLRPEEAIRDVSFTLQAGELLLVAGASGCGKTTLARCINGLIPQSYRGDLSGSVRLYGREVREMPRREIAQTVGTLLQDPERQIVASRVLGELAFGPENLGLPLEQVRARVEEVIQRMGIEHLRHRETFSLSGGEKQKVALAAVLAMRPSILILDEPLAQLDPASAREALRIFRRLADEGVAVLLIEHRVEDVLSINPDQVLYLSEGQVRYYGPVEGLYERVDPQEVKLPAPRLIERLRAVGAPPAPVPPRPDPGEPVLAFEAVGFAYPDGPEVLHDVDLEVRRGEVVAVLGPNGAGKSTLMKHAIGLLKPDRGRVLVAGQDTRETTVAQVAHTVGYAFQSPTHMLFAPTVREELAFGPRNLGFSPEAIEQAIAEALRLMNLEGLEAYPPLALSFGQQKRLTIACVVAMRSRILALDEPTAGQDYGNYMRFMDSIVGVDGRAGFDAVLFISHDLDLAIVYATRVVLLSEGRVAADGPPEEVLQDVDLLERCRIVPTSLLEANLRALPKTGRFLRPEALAALAGA